MRKIIAILAILFCFTGCGGEDSQDAEEAFTLSASERKGYEEEMDQVLRSFYWKYDENSIAFFQEEVPRKEEEQASEIFEASDKAELNLSAKAGMKSVVATVNLQYFNGDDAGVAYFYFVNKSMAGVYYKGPGGVGVYSLKDRNIYTGNPEFAQYETEAPMAQFSEKKTNFPAEGFCAMGQDGQGRTLLAVNDNNRIIIYRYSNSNFTLYKNIYFDDKEQLLFSAAFYPMGNQKGDGLAILLGKEEAEELRDINVQRISEKVVFYDDNLRKLNNEMILESGSISAIACDGEDLVLANGRTLEYFSKGQDDIWTKYKQYSLNHGVRFLWKDDLDHNGVPEYLMEDGMDFYVYHKEDKGFQTLWKTHLGVKSLNDSIYTGDLNQDGIKEIYACDNTGTTIRYIVSEKGIVSRNEDIDYGQRFYVGDFDRDGKDDFIKIGDIENVSRMLYLAQ